MIGLPFVIAPEKFAAFALVTGLTSVIPGPSMLFIMGQSIWRGPRAAVVALAGVELGYVLWWTLAALGLGTLAAAVPLAFTLLAIGGSLYLAWLGLQALRHASHAEDGSPAPARHRSDHPFRDGIVVALSNPKSLIYIVALVPPFVDARHAVVPQLIVLAAMSLFIDVALAALYILAGNRLARAISRPDTRKSLDRAVGVVFIAIALGILAQLGLGGH